MRKIRTNFALNSYSRSLSIYLTFLLIYYPSGIFDPIVFFFSPLRFLLLDHKLLLTDPLGRGRALFVILLGILKDILGLLAFLRAILRNSLDLQLAKFLSNNLFVL